MKKITSFLFILGLVFCLSGIGLSDTNIILLPTTTCTYTNDNLSNGSLSKDGDFNTGFGYSYAGASGTANPIVEFSFSTPIRITQLDFRIAVSGYEYGDDTGYITLEYYIQWYDGSWKEVLPGYTPSTPTDTHYYGSWHQYHDSMSRSKDSGHIALTGLNLVNCSKIKVYAYATSYNNKKSNANGSAYIYEIQAFGVIDIGLRAYDGSNIIKIACEPTGILTSPLRISKNGTIYAVTLVDPQDPRGSRLRIKTSSGIKALRKY
ncbi:MAG: hypothetical protein NC828_02550 [Candidatus Omnitrophica bacterium]|nr:hypothetical protein [Candidatus Omnitrophota bacterium]